MRMITMIITITVNVSKDHWLPPCCPVAKGGTAATVKAAEPNKVNQEANLGERPPSNQTAK